MIWRTRRRALDLSQAGIIMGVLNVTPDSFSDGGRYTDLDAACAHALALVADGAEIIDVGGESTRPGAEPVPADVELSRVVPVIERIRQCTDALVSIDTSKAVVAEAALLAGADIVNDVTALRGDPAMADVVRHSSAGLVMMHMQGAPRTMQNAPQYRDVVSEVRDFLRQQLDVALACGIDSMCVALDPGIGFGKTPEHNRALLAHTAVLSQCERPILIGVSRKSFLASIAGSRSIEDRFWPAVAITSFCREHGARLFRVHDPKPHLHALRMTEAILAGS